MRVLSLVLVTRGISVSPLEMVLDTTIRHQFTCIRNSSSLLCIMGYSGYSIAQETFKYQHT